MLKDLLVRARQARTAELQGDEAAEAGFTLIELMVVLLILAILMAIAIPTFLGVTSGANDRAAQSNLTNALTEASALYQSNNQSFSNLSTSTFQASAPEFTWTTGGVKSQNSIDVLSTSDGNGIALATLSKTGYCWYVLNFQQNPVSAQINGTNIDSSITTAGTYYGKSASTETTCYASDAVGVKSSGTSYAKATSVTPAASGNV